MSIEDRLTGMADASETLQVLSLGAGVQSTALLMLSAEGVLPKLGAAIFADTGWEPKAVYDHLDRLEREIAAPAGIPIYRVSAGNIRDDALDPTHRFASMPLYVRQPDGSKGITRRQCTSEYKVRPIKEQIRKLLGAKEENGTVGRVKKGLSVSQWIGISLDEIHRAKDADVQYIKNEFPLLELRWTRDHCIAYLDKRGWGDTPKSACIGCPFHGNAAWRDLRDNAPDEFADAIAFDEAVRAKSSAAGGSRLSGEVFLHRSLLPLSIAPIDHVTRMEREKMEADVDLFIDTEVDFTCSPFSCRADEYDLSAYEVKEDSL